MTKLIGILMACMGIAVVFKPETMKKMVFFWKQDKRIYVAGLLRVIFGSVFLLSAPQAERFPWVIYFSGVFIFFGAIIIFALGLNKIKAMLDRWDKKPVSVLRYMGILFIAMGALVIYSA